MVPQGSEVQIKIINLQNKMAVKVTKKVKYAMAHVQYHKIKLMSQGVHFTRKFHAFFKKCTTFGLCRPITIIIVSYIVKKQQ